MKTIFVTGATGNQGGAVAASLMRIGFKVKALTRNPDSPKAQLLAQQNAEIIKGDLDDLNSFRTHLNNVDGIFSVQTFLQRGTVKEIEQGVALANAAKESGVDHFVYASVAGADLNTGIPHFESKLLIENHIKLLSLPYTIIRPASFFENFLIPDVSNRINKGKLASPISKHAIQQFIAAIDIGKIGADIFANRDKFLGKTITLSSEEMDNHQVAMLFSEVLGKEIRYQKLPLFIARLLLGKDLYKMFKWINENNSIFIKDLAQFKKEYPGLTSLREWIEVNFKSD